jgi:hypothetical protein
MTQYVLIVSDGTGRTRAEGPFDIELAMTRRNALWDRDIGLHIEIVMMGDWDYET